MRKYIDKSAIVYGIVGVINTLVGYGIMFGSVFIGIIPEFANTIAYGIASILSYILNKKFTFQSNRTHKRDFTRFMIATLIAYLSNLSVLIMCYRVFLWNEYLALIIANIIYVIVGYVLHKFWTFR